MKDAETFWEAIPSGNRRFFEQTLVRRDEAHVNGARNHLAVALPQRIGYICMETGAQADQARSEIVRAYTGVQGRQEDIEALADDEVWRLGEEALRDPDVRRLVFEARNQKPAQRTLQLMVDKSHRLQGDAARNYMTEKRQSVSNILRKVIIPQLSGQAAKEAFEEGR